MNRWMAAVKGLIIGSTMMVPGVSGGSMAMILGIYDRLISAIGSFRRKPMENGIFLGLFVLSAGFGILVFASPLSWLLEHYKMPTMYFFLGAVFGGIPLIGQKSGVQKLSWDVIAYMLAGAAGVILIAAIPEGIVQAGTEEGIGSWPVFFVVGVISAVALILPGISISHFFLILGLYNELLKAIQIFDFQLLFPLGLGLLIGVVLFSKILDYVLREFPRPAYLMILGFILGSAAQIFPGIPKGFSAVLCVGMVMAGFWAVSKISR